MFSQPSPGSSQKAPNKRTRNSRNVPAPNARRARAAREQGLHATHHTRNLDARDALATLVSWCLLVLCSGSSRRSLCFSPRVFRRCRGLQASARARLQAGAASRMFSQPSPGSSQKVPETSTRNSRNAPAPNARPARAACFRSLPRDRARKLRTKTLEKLTKRSSFLVFFFEALDFSKNATLSTRKTCFLRSGGSQNGAKMTSNMLRKSSSGAGGLRETLRERFWRVLPQEVLQRSPRAPRERQESPK